MVNEQKAAKAENQGGTAQNNDGGNQPSTRTLIDRANEAAKKLAEENARMEANLRHHEEIMSREILGGKSEAGTIKQPEPEVSPQDYAKSILQGKPLSK